MKQKQSQKISWRRVKMILKKEILQWLRDPLILLVFLSAVTLQLILFGYAVDSGLKNIPFFYVDQDQTALSRSLVDGITRGGYFTLMGSLTDETELKNALRKNQGQVGILIPGEFSKNLYRGEIPSVKIYLDGTQAATALIVQRYLRNILSGFSEKWVSANTSGGSIREIPKLEAEIKVVPNPQMKDSFFMIPGVLGAILILMITGLSAAVFSREKDMGTLESLLASPLQPLEFFLGKSLPLFALGLVNALIGLGVALFYFKIPLTGSVSLLFFSTVLFIIFCVALGFMAAKISTTQYQAVVSSTLVVFPSLFVSGGLDSSANWPDVLKWAAWGNPLYYFVQLTRGVFLQGETWGSSFHYFIPLALFAFALTWLSIRQVRGFFSFSRTKG